MNLIRQLLQRSAWLAQRYAIGAISKRLGALHALCVLISGRFLAICWGWNNMVSSAFCCNAYRQRHSKIAICTDFVDTFIIWGTLLLLLLPTTTTILLLLPLLLLPLLLLLLLTNLFARTYPEKGFCR
jgi:hypothetical protein